ncbi:hypothetical protein TA3x_003638 [Tundrisphaera sp. TA3]|uniref:hypothetical protein n=1 Tax=Tundrisphaera sp. TA3 TaxID=3435775 RepID=UPI003EBDBFD3
MSTTISRGFILTLAVLATGCRPPAAPPQPADIVFDISLRDPLPNGRPVVEIKPNGKPRPTGTAPSGGYFLMTRRNGNSYYVRWFSTEEAAAGTRYDLDIPNNPAVPMFSVGPEDRLTVGVENIDSPDGSKYVRLSNVLDLPTPPTMATPAPATPPDAQK